ncbi:MAG: MoaD/ThiS family protein [Gammaproteobacteria bacterium]
MWLLCRRILATNRRLNFTNRSAKKKKCYILTFRPKLKPNSPPSAKTPPPNFSKKNGGRRRGFGGNWRFATPAAEVRDGDEVAIFPPVTGG